MTITEIQNEGLQTVLMGDTLSLMLENGWGSLTIEAYLAKHNEAQWPIPATDREYWAFCNERDNVEAIDQTARF